MSEHNINTDRSFTEADINNLLKSNLSERQIQNLKTNLGRGWQVSACDLDLLVNHLWSSTNGYALTAINGKTSYLHRLVHARMTGRDVSDYTRSEHVRHVENRKSDCRRENLWLHASAQSNQQDLNRSLNDNNTSGVSGVVWNKPTSSWLVQLRWNHRQMHLGLYTDKDTAAKVATHCREIRHQLTMNGDCDLSFTEVKSLLKAEALKIGGAQ